MSRDRTQTHLLWILSAAFIEGFDHMQDVFCSRHSWLCIGVHPRWWPGWRWKMEGTCCSCRLRSGWHTDRRTPTMYFSWYSTVLVPCILHGRWVSSKVAVWQEPLTLLRYSVRCYSMVRAIQCSYQKYCTVLSTVLSAAFSVLSNKHNAYTYNWQHCCRLDSQRRRDCFCAR